MPKVSIETARRLIDAFAMAIDGKPSSAKTFSLEPFSDLKSFEAWEQQGNDSQSVTPRTRALLLAYLVMSGGTIPYQGIPIEGAWFRPDVWVAGSLVKLGYLEPDDPAGVFRMTHLGWELVAETLEAI